MQDSTDLLVNQGIKTEHGLPAISGLGFERLSVGTEYFEEYSIQRIVEVLTLKLRITTTLRAKQKILKRDSERMIPMKSL